MKRNKLQKFNELKTFDNVLEYTDQDFKKNIKDLLSSTDYICLELGCGNGDFSIELAKNSPSKLFIGIDIQGERLWHGAKNATFNKVPNVYFIRMFIDSIDEFVPKHSIDEIWITFPDPYPKKSKAQKRLTSNRFLEKYKKIMKDKGNINFKTDDNELFKFTLDELKNNGWKILSSIEDVHTAQHNISELNICTKFENKWINLGKKIFFLRFTS